MAKFPRSESEITTLAQDLIAGLNSQTDHFPAPPVPPTELETALAAYVTAREAAIIGTGAAAQATAAKDETLESLVDLMKADIRYAENTTRFDDGKLTLLGWGGRKSRTSQEVPGQVRSLAAVREGDGWIALDWKAPRSGGEVAAYRIRRRLSSGGSWEDAGMAVDAEITLTGQERGVEFLYHVVAANKAGDGEPSNIVTAVL